MYLADFNAALQQATQRILRLLKFHREMAGVVIHAEMLGEPRIVRMIRPHAIENLDCFAAAFEQAQRLGFEAEMHFAPGLWLKSATCSTQRQMLSRIFFKSSPWNGIP